MRIWPKKQETVHFFVHFTYRSSRTGLNNNNKKNTRLKSKNIRYNRTPYTAIHHTTTPVLMTAPETHHLYTRFASAQSPCCDFVTTSGEVMATGELTLPQSVIASLLALQKKGIAYLDAFPNKATPTNRILYLSHHVINHINQDILTNQEMLIRILLTPSAFVSCTPTNSNTKSINNHIKEVINFVYNITTHDDSKNNNNNNNNNNSNNIDNKNDNSDSSTTTPTASTTTTTNTTTEGESASGESATGESATGESASAEPGTESHAPLFDPLQVYSAVKPTNTEPQLDASIILYI
jgi:hypothetical protein